MAKTTHWQPIENAPKDGTHILVLDVHCTAVQASWEGYWMFPYGFSEVNATHWMPLPPLPNAVITDGSKRSEETFGA
jgi:hypothetical protein